MRRRTEGSGWTTAAIWLGIVSVGVFATSFAKHDYVGGSVIGVILATAAVRCWYLGG